MKKGAICLAALMIWFLPWPATAASAAGVEIPAAAPAQPAAEAPAVAVPEPAPAAAAGGDRSAEYPDGLIYTVSEGDTLWDLSAKYLGSPWKWGTLWERNRYLTNPHYIYPGIRLEIFPPPVKQYAALPEPPADAAPAEPPKAEAEPPPPPPPRKETVRLLDIKPADYVRAGEFLREPPRGIGSIVRGDEDRVAFSTDDKVYLGLSKELPAGQLVGVYRVRGPVKAAAERTISGYVRSLIGVIQLLPKENGVAAGRVRLAFEDLLRTDLISEDIPAYAPVPLAPGGDGVEATVITGRDDKTEFSAGDFVYLSRGAAAGLAAGNGLRLYDLIDAPKGSASGEKLRIEVGRAVVVRCSPEFSTALVTGSVQSFSAGIVARGGAGAAARN